MHLRLSVAALVATCVALPFGFLLATTPIAQHPITTANAGQEALLREMLDVDAGGCRYLSVIRSQGGITAGYACGDDDVRVAVELRLRDPAAPSHTRTPALDIVAKRGAPPELLDALVPRVRALGGTVRWHVTDPNPMPPLDVRFEYALTGLFFGIATFAFVCELHGRRLMVTAMLLFGVALGARLLVPRVPMNNYSDLLVPFVSYRWNASYYAGPYDVLWVIFHTPDAVFTANLLYGALVPVLLFLALDADNEYGVAALPFAIVVAIVPLYVRLSASESPHIAAQLMLAAGALLYRRAIERNHAGSSVVDALGVFLAAALVGSIRRELTTAPLAYLALLCLYGQSISRKRVVFLSAVVLGGVAAAATLTHIARHGAGNYAANLNPAELVRAFLSVIMGLPWVYLVRVRYIPTVLALGAGFLLIRSWKLRRRGLILVYLGGTTVLCAHHALGGSQFSNLRQLIPYWSMARYPSLWLQYPLYFAVLGLVQLYHVAAQLPWRRKVLVIGGSVLLCVGVVPQYWSLVTYHAEYLFLHNFLDRNPDVPAIAAGWRKHAAAPDSSIGGYDYCESLALPYFTLSTAKRTWYISDGSVPEAFMRSLPDGTLFFVNALGQISKPPTYDKASWRNLAEYRRLRCLAEQSGDLVTSWSGRTAERAQSEFADRNLLKLEILRFHRERLSAAEAACPSVEGEFQSWAPPKP